MCTSGGKYKSATGGANPVGCDPPLVAGTFLPDIDVTKPTPCASPDAAFGPIGFMNGALDEWMAEPVDDPQFAVPAALTSSGRSSGAAADCSRVAITASTAKTGVHGIRCCAD